MPDSWPNNRPVDYNPDKVFDEDTETWTDSPAIKKQTGGRYRQHIVALVEGNEIYFTTL